tara:strand:+ start:1107 stop:1859 length:753 start_codon:yes stop_codon:yes gene_type:complete
MKNNYKKFTKLAKNLRIKTFNKFIEMKEAHLGGSFSMIEILISLYYSILKKNDKFILSKAHGSIPLCLILRDKGFKPKISTHLEIDIKNGIECTTGSLGHGLPIAVGISIARKKKKSKGIVYVLISDGECQEGTTWESLLIASKFKLDNLVILVDYNKIQALQRIDDVLPLNNLKDKFTAFGFKSYEIKNGHSFKEIIDSLNKIKNNKLPKILIINTIKGKGIPEFENDPIWHAKKLKEKDIIIGRKSLL